MAVPLAGCLQPPDPKEAFTGNWREQAYRPSQSVGQSASYRLDGDSFQATTADGRSFDAVVGGDDATVPGEPPMTVSVDRVPAIAIRQVFKRDGKPVRVVTVAILNRETLLAVEQEGGKPPELALAARE